MTPIHFTALLALSGLAASARAQSADSLTRGTRIRVAFPATDTQPERYLHGLLWTLAGDTVILYPSHTAASPDTVVLGGGRRLETPRPGRSAAAPGAVVGAMGGAVIGAVLASAAWEPCEQTGWFACIMYPSQGEQAASGAILGGLAGALLGYSIGGTIRHDTWAPVPTDGVTVGLSPRGVAIRIAF